MKNILFRCASLLLWATAPVHAQTSGPAVVPAVVVVRVFDSGNNLIMDIARSEGKHEHREYKPWDLRQEGAAAELTRQLLAQLYQEGYGLNSTYGGGDHYNSTTTLVFTQR